MADRLKDKVAIVTGAGSVSEGWGNGKATAVLFAREAHGQRCQPRLTAYVAPSILLGEAYQDDSLDVHLRRTRRDRDPPRSERNPGT